MSGNEKRWEQFVDEVATDGLIWTIQKSGEYVTSSNRYGTKCFPWWSSRKRVLKQIEIVPAYKGYQQIGFEWNDFLLEWISHLKQEKCLLGVNYAKKENIGFDLPIDEVVNAVSRARV